VSVETVPPDFSPSYRPREVAHVTHPNLAHVATEDFIRAELFQSKWQIERELKAAPRHFSYPHPALNPQWTPQTVALTQEAGYETAVTTTPGGAFPGENPLLLPRIMAPNRAKTLNRFIGGTNTGEVYLAYSSIVKKTATELLTQRRVSGILAELDLLGLVEAAVVSKGRRGRTKRIRLLLEPETLNKILGEDPALAGLF